MASVPNGSANYPTLITDKIGGYITGNFIPNPLPPQAPLGKVKVDHQKGRLVIGSSNLSGGLPVADLIWQKFQDHAIHRNVVTPVK